MAAGIAGTRGRVTLYEAILQRRPGSYECPTHSSKNKNSVSLMVEGGTVLLKDFGGCSTKDILGALGLDWSALFNGDKPRKPQGQTLGRVVDTYRYTDENGIHLYDNVRFEPKDFRPRKPDGSWNLIGVRRVLYRLPELRRAVDVFFCEGEKDTDALCALGLNATTSGSATSWRDEFVSSFQHHQHVTVLPHNDEPGHKYGRQVASALHGVVASIKVLDLPGLPENGGDVFDWLTGKDRETAAEELCILADRVWEWIAGTTETATTEAVDAKAGMKFIGMRELLNEPEEQHSWLIEGLLPMGGDSLCVAKPKVGKSTLARCAALAVARGQDFLGRKTTQGPVFYLALEEKKAEVRRHFVAMGVTEEDPIFLFCASSPADGLDQLREAMKLRKPIFVIVDPLFRFVRVKDGNDYAAVTNALEPLHSLARESGAHVMAAHHAGKAGDRDGGDSVLGSTAIFAAVDTLLIMKRHDKYRTLSSIQRYGTDLEEITLTYDEQTRTLTPGVARADADVAVGMKDIIGFLNTQSEPVEWRVINDGVEGRKQIKWQAMKRCLDAGTTNRIGNGKRGDPYLYSVSSSGGSAYIAGTRKPETIT